MNATLTSPELTRADRCDRCGAAARVRAKLPSGAELLFCQHHANEHEAKLIELAAVLEVSPAEASTPNAPACRIWAGRHFVRNAGLVMTDQPVKPSPPSHLAHLEADTVEELGRLDLLRVCAGGASGACCRCRRCCWGCWAAWPTSRRCSDPETLPVIQDQLISTANSFFSQNVVSEIIEPTIRDIVRGARGEVVSIGFVISLWAGSSAVSAFVDSVVEAHDQTPLRHPVRQRFFALGLYVVMLVIAIATAPLRRAGTAQDRRAHSGKLGQRAAVRLLPGARGGTGGVGDSPLPGVAAQAAALAPAGRRRGAGHRGVPGGHGRLADLPDATSPARDTPTARWRLRSRSCCSPSSSASRS